MSDFAPRPWLPTAEYYIADGPNGTLDIRDVIEAFELNYNRGAVVKYIARAGRKPGNDAALDLVKAREHINREIASVGGGDVPSGERRQCGWLIERYIHNRIHFWNAGALSHGRTDGFTDLIGDAVRFAREEDAMIVLSRVCDGNGRLAKHLWIDRP